METYIEGPKELLFPGILSCQVLQRCHFVVPDLVVPLLVSQEIRQKDDD